MQHPSVLWFPRLLPKVFVAMALVPLLGVCQTVKETVQKGSPQDQLMSALYVGYFLPSGMRDIGAEEGWRNLKLDASSLLARSPEDTTLKFVVAFADGELARRAKDFRTAEAQFQSASVLNRNFALPYLALAETALDKGDSSSAHGMLYAASIEVPKTVPASFLHLAFTRLGELYERDGKFTDALKAYKSAVEAKPKWLGGRTTLAATYLKLNQAALALPQAQEAIAIAPKDAYANALLGQVQSRLGHHESAVRAFKNAIEIDPGNANYQYMLGLEYESSGKKLDALHCYNAAKLIAERDKSYGELLPNIQQALSRLQ